MELESQKKDESCGVTYDYWILQDCMNQENFLNCPEEIYEKGAETYRKIKAFVESKLKASDCGRMVKDLFLIYGMFW